MSPTVASGEVNHSPNVNLMADTMEAGGDGDRGGGCEVNSVN